MNTNLRKRILKKLIKDTCGKTVFTANRKLYQQIDSIGICSSLGPLLANIITRELEWKVIKQIVDDETLKETKLNLEPKLPYLLTFGLEF